MDLIMQKLLNKLSLCYPFKLSFDELNEIMTEKQAKALFDLKILRNDNALTSIFCQNCQNEHDVVIHSKTEAFLVCADENTGRISINPKTLKTYQFDILGLLKLIKKELKITDEPKNLIGNNLWQVGKIKKDNKEFLIFYSRIDELDNFTDFFNNYKSAIKNFIVFTNTEILSFKNNIKAEIVTIPIVDILKKTLAFDKPIFDEYLNNAFRQVIFQNNGDLIVNGRSIGNITPATPEYFFIDILWKNFNQPVSHEDIFLYCKEKLNKKDYSSTAQSFCGKMKSSIKKQLKNKIVDKIFESTKTKNGLNAYKMTNPK